jgi:pantothenate kinase
MITNNKQSRLNKNNNNNKNKKLSDSMNDKPNLDEVHYHPMNHLIQQMKMMEL